MPSHHQHLLLWLLVTCQCALTAAVLSTLCCHLDFCTCRCAVPAALRVSCRYNPQDVNKAALLLGSGAILGMRFQAYEAHIPFLLQLKVGGAGDEERRGEGGRGCVPGTCFLTREGLGDTDPDT